MGIERPILRYTSPEKHRPVPVQIQSPVQHMQSFLDLPSQYSVIYSPDARGYLFYRD